jgi:hypothetical protein
MEKNPNIGIADNISNAQTTTVKVTTKQEKEMTTKPKRKYNIEPVFGVLTKAKNQFMHQVIKDNDTKRKCIEANITKHYDDDLRYWLDFNKKTGVLLDSVKFNEYCSAKKQIARQVAEHTVFEGKAFYNAVIQGNYGLLDEMSYMFNDYLFQDTENIYNQPTQIATS